MLKSEAAAAILVTKLLAATSCKFRFLTGLARAETTVSTRNNLETFPTSHPVLVVTTIARERAKGQVHRRAGAKLRPAEFSYGIMARSPGCQNQNGSPSQRLRNASLMKPAATAQAMGMPLRHYLGTMVRPAEFCSTIWKTGPLSHPTHPL